MAGEAADRALLDGHQHLMRARQPADQILVERLGEAGVGNRGRKPGRAKLLGRRQAILQPRAEGEQRDLGAFLTMRPLPISRIEPRSGMSTPTPLPRG